MNEHNTDPAELITTEGDQADMGPDLSLDERRKQIERELQGEVLTNRLKQLE